MLKRMFTLVYRLALLLWFLGTIIVGMWLWRENNVAVTANYFGFVYEGQTLGMIMASMLVIGFGLGSFPLVIRSLLKEFVSKRKITSMKRSLDAQSVEKTSGSAHE